MKICKVARCDAPDCAYNREGACHTLAITVGDDSNPMCDTFCKTQQKGGDAMTFASVGACKVAACSHNESLECQLTRITVGWNGSEPDCLSFGKR
jgi:hypothetical protein